MRDNESNSFPHNDFSSGPLSPNPSFTTLSSNPFRSPTRLFSSWSSFSATATATASTPLRRDEPEGGDGESKAYCQARKFARPATVEWSTRLHNFISIIGTVEYPLKHWAVKDGQVRAYTILLVKPSPDSHRHFRVTLWMRDLLAERALVHLKPSDYIYVSGLLGSYTKSTSEGKERMYYKVTAKELNYVQVPNENYQVATDSGREAGESREQKRRNRLHTWQLLFANPYDWYDQRKTKKSPRLPDFKHKSTGEALWLSVDDPSWVKKQVDLLDSRITGRLIDDVPFGSFTSDWVSDNQVLDSRHTRKLSDQINY